MDVRPPIAERDFDVLPTLDSIRPPLLPISRWEPPPSRRVYLDDAEPSAESERTESVELSFEIQPSEVFADCSDDASGSITDENPIAPEVPIDGHPCDRVGGFEIVQRLGLLDGFELSLGMRDCLGVKCPAIIKSAVRVSPTYDMDRVTLMREAEGMGQTNHPNLVTLVDVFEGERGTHLVYEYIEGTSLKRASEALRDRDEALPYDLIVWIVAEVLRGTAVLHGLRPRDESAVVLKGLHPARVLVSVSGHVKLALFAMPTFRAEPRADWMSEQPAYIPPEHFTEGAADPRSDVYSAGVMLLELLGGRPCFEQPTTPAIVSQIVHEGLETESLENELVPAPLVKIVKRAISRDPAARYQSAAAMLRALEHWLDDDEHHASPSTIARFFRRQDLFAGPESANDPLETPVPVAAALQFDQTLSAIIIREDLDIEIDEDPTVAVVDVISAVDDENDPTMPELSLSPPAIVMPVAPSIAEPPIDAPPIPPHIIVPAIAKPIDLGHAAALRERGPPSERGRTKRTRSSAPVSLAATPAWMEPDPSVVLRAPWQGHFAKALIACAALLAATIALMVIAG